MNYSKFSIRILKVLRQQLENEAGNEGRSINRQLEVILKERYQAHNHAPPTTTIQRARSVSKSSTGRKSKAAIS